jgi:hypothetical protein
VPQLQCADSRSRNKMDRATISQLSLLRQQFTHAGFSFLKDCLC